MVKLLFSRALGTFLALINIKVRNLSQMYPRTCTNDVARMPSDSSRSSLWPNAIWTLSQNCFGYNYWPGWATNAKLVSIPCYLTIRNMLECLSLWLGVSQPACKILHISMMACIWKCILLYLNLCYLGQTLCLLSASWSLYICRPLVTRLEHSNSLIMNMASTK